MSARRIVVGVIALLALAYGPPPALAHPLGNFTINHYAGVRVEPERILLDVVIDQAEIPAFQARQLLDVDDDGQLSDAEVERARRSSCETLATELRLTVAGSPTDLGLTAAGLSLPPGVGGLPTMRLVCGFEAHLAAPLDARTEIAFEDASYPGRLGWREIVVEGSGMTVAEVEGTLRTATESARLTEYPAARLDLALADERIVVAATPGGSTLPPWTIPDAAPVAALPGEPLGPAGESPGPAGQPAPGGPPGRDGLAEAIPALFQTADLTPWVLLASLLAAAALGAGHALTPGHGKTLMAAYLVGARGTPVHAIGLGLSVSVSHTMGILLLAVLVSGAQSTLSPEVVARWAPLVAAVSILAIGCWMVFAELRRRAALRAADHHHGGGANDDGDHDHGRVRHGHPPPPGSSIGWRSLFVLGLAGGIVPSTSALLIVLATMAAGRPAFGVLLVVAFGLGMALVMTGVGLVMTLGRARLDRFAGNSVPGRLRGLVPLAASGLVLVLGAILTLQAVAAVAGT